MPNAKIVTYNNLFENVFGSLFNNIEDEKNKSNSILIIPTNKKKYQDNIQTNLVVITNNMSMILTNIERGETTLNGDI